VSLRVGIVDYLNSRPLAWGFLSGRLADDYQASYHPPARVAEMLAGGQLDVGLIPSIEVQRIPGLVVVPGLCVAATHEVRSVLLVSERPFEEVESVALDENSRTSAALVKIVLGDSYGVRPETTTRAPRVEEMLREADAALVIGDPALSVDRERYRILDLAAEWRRLTGKPFVFAVWAVREGIDSAGLGSALESSLTAGFEEMDRIIDQAVDELSLSREVVERYLSRHLRFEMGQEELAGLEEFYLRAAAYGAIAEPRAVRFVR
jgi:chorismate dehydratase